MLWVCVCEAGKLPKHNNISWRGTRSCLKDGKFEGLVGGYHDSGDATKFHFLSSFSIENPCPLRHKDVVEDKEKGNNLSSHMGLKF